ncbi:MAG: saccharopine dehydrogenase [Gammaproteobacteria bacterium]|nr:MAG: saccharopine dehydrogenase [Gammaproteobacteria bacterium]
MSAEVVIYGASGYTGKLIAWHLAEYGIPFIAAGRNQQRLEEEMAGIAELQGHDYQCVAVDHDEAALCDLFRGKKIVYNVVGPFMQLADPVVKAALECGCHYLDTTGEQDWMFYARKKYGAQFEEKGLVLIPACSWMWVGGLLAAEVALEHQGVDTLDLLYLADSFTSVASTMSFMRMLVNDQYYLKDNALLTWPRAKPYQVSVPDTHIQLQALPWGGGGEVVWYENDDRVSNCSVMVAFRNEEMVGAVIDAIKGFEENSGSLEGEAREQQTNAMGNAMVSEEPDREDPNINRSIISCKARGNTASVNVVLRGSGPYLQTATFAAEACKRLLNGQQRGVGAISPAAAFGARELIAAVAERGYLTWTETNS